MGGEVATKQKRKGKEEHDKDATKEKREGRREKGNAKKITKKT